MPGWFPLEFAWILLCLSFISALIQAVRKLSLCLKSTVPVIKRRAKNRRRNAKRGGSVVGGAGVLKADFPSVANDVDAILQVIVERDDVFPRAVVLRVDRNIQVLDLVLEVANLILERLGGIAGRLARAAVILKVIRVECGGAVADLLVKIGEPAVFSL